ncbi:MAG: hypothetical protein HYR59_07030 [Acidobacteria bacterium]|nr:hypothetical protein [Acidobacteriota bacterium]
MRNEPGLNFWLSASKASSAARIFTSFKRKRKVAKPGSALALMTKNFVAEPETLPAAAEPPLSASRSDL